MDSVTPIPIVKTNEKMVLFASKKVRFLAFMLDFMLVLAFAITIIANIITPKYYAAAYHQFMQTNEDFVQKYKVDKDAKRPELSEAETEMFGAWQSFTLFSFWIYFAFSEIFMKGASLGKRAFSIHVVSRRTMQPPGVFDSFLRAGLKALSLIALFPILIVNYLIIFVTKKNQTGHDILTRTLVVVDEIEEAEVEEEVEEMPEA